MKRLMQAVFFCSSLLLAGCGGGGADDVAESPSAQANVPVRQAQLARLDTDGLLNWAERTFPLLFPGPQANRTADPFVFRAYGNGMYLGVAFGDVYALGPLTGGAIVRLGSVASFTCVALSSSCAATGATVTGTVMARGVALAGATVTLRDSTGASRTATTNTSGSFTLSVAGLSPPYVLSATGSSGGVNYTLYSVSASDALSGTQRINLSAWTTALVAMLSPTGRAAQLSPVTHVTRITTVTVTQVVTYSRTLIAPTLTDNGLSTTTYSPITDPAPLASATSGAAAVDVQTTTGVGPNDTVFMGRACVPQQLGSCPRYTKSPETTTEQPNVCGHDIASGSPIACDPAQPASATPAPIAVSPSAAYGFGCMGCVFWGPRDNYATVPTQTPLRVSTFTYVGTTPTPPTSGGNEVWQATFSATACVAGFCASAGDTVGGTTYNAQATCNQAAALIAQTLNAQAIPGFSYTFTCRRIS